MTKTASTTWARDRVAERQELQALIQWIHRDLNTRLKGQEIAVETSLAAFLAGGHLLLEGPPGVGKTSLARALADVFEGQFHRIQMTSDLLPGEIVGVIRPTADGSRFEFRQGPVFCNFLLADELNRTSPKTQAALLEAMAEHTVTVDGQTHVLPNPFFVVATQNPLESHGVYPLAESQLDRFMLQVTMDLPGEAEEQQIYRAYADRSKPRANAAGDSSERTRFPLMRVGELREWVESVHVDESVLGYATEILRKTRSHPEVAAGVSVRGGMQFLAAMRALAFLRGKDYVSPVEARDLAVPALAHRLKLADGRFDGEPRRAVIREILAQVPAPK